MKVLIIEYKEDLLQVLNYLQEDTIVRMDFEGEEADENDS